MEYKYALLMDIIEGYSDFKKIKPSETFNIFEDNGILSYIVDNHESIGLSTIKQNIKEIEEMIDRSSNKNGLYW